MITLNCFTNGFDGETSTQPGLYPNLCRWVYRQPDFDGVTIFEDGDIWSGAVDSVKSKYKVGWLHEPRALHPENYAKAVEWRQKFDCILTHSQALLDGYPDKFRHCIHAGVSIPREHWGVHPKSKGVGMFDTHKSATAGHRLRHKIADMIKDIDVHIGLYGDAKIETMKQYRFWVVVENSDEPSWFTEHVLDPIALGCVPVYYWPRGSVTPHSLDKFIDFSGVDVFSSVDDLPFILEQYRIRPDLGERPCQVANIARLADLQFVEDWMVTHPLAEYLS